MKNELHRFENFIHFSLWTLTCFYSLYKLVRAQTEIIENNQEPQYEIRDLNPGWRSVSRLKDESDVEWSTWKYHIQTSWFYMLIQFVVSEIIRRTNTSLLKYWYTISSVIYILKYMGLRQLIIIFAQPVIFAVFVLTGGKKISIWLISIFLLAGYNTLKYKYFFWRFLDTENLEDEEVFVMLYAIAWVELRCISFCLDYVDKTEKYLQARDKAKLVQASVSEELINMFSYVLYLPLLFVGPVILYEEFERSFHKKNENLSMRLKSFFLDMMRFLIYTMLLEFAFHYVYFFAMQSHMEAIHKLPSLALCGGGLWMGLEFHMKYVISYGTTTAYSRLDNIDPPPTPRCIFRIHVYSQMWRYFDVGLYRFLLKYIYKPVFYTLSQKNKTMPKITYKLLSSLITFMFIFMWHGTMWNIMVWSVLNYAGIVVEYIGKAVAESEKYKLYKAKVLKTNAMEVRFTAFLCAPLLGLSAISNFYLFAGSDIGNLYFGLLQWPSLYNSVLVYMSLYCCCHVAIALNEVPSRTDVKKNEIKTVL